MSGQLSSTSGTSSVWKTISLAGQVNPGPQTLNTLSKPHYRDLRCFVARGPPIKFSRSPPVSLLYNSFQMRIEFLFLLFLKSVYVIICKSYQKWTMRHKRGTHTHFNEVFTDNSNCQILVPNDIVQSADAHNCLSLSNSPPPR